MDYIIWDFEGPIGRKTYSLLATRSCLVKVFRLQRKTLLLFFGFFFPIIIKVFRFQRKTLLLLFAFSFFIIKVFRLLRKTLLLLYAFSFFIKVFRFQRKTLLFLLGFFFPIIIFFSYRFCSADFSKTPRSIFMKFSHMIPYD